MKIGLKSSNEARESTFGIIVMNVELKGYLILPIPLDSTTTLRMLSPMVSNR